MCLLHVIHYGHVSTRLFTSLKEVQTNLKYISKPHALLQNMSQTSCLVIAY
jgi:hypothetical protein